MENYHGELIDIDSYIENRKKYIEQCKQGYENLPCDLTFKRYAEHFKKNNYAEWVLRREGMKAYHDKVEPYIERDISKIEVGDVLIADGHVLNF